MADPDPFAEPVAIARRKPAGIPRALGGSGRFARTFSRHKRRASSKPSTGAVGPVEREPRRRSDIREQVGKLIVPLRTGSPRSYEKGLLRSHDALSWAALLPPVRRHATPA